LRSLWGSLDWCAMYELPSSDAKTLKIDLECKTLNKNLLKGLEIAS
jgi:hypothetical protein